MLTAAFQDGDNGIPIRYRFNGKLFNLRGLQAKSKVHTEVLDEFRFVHDMAKGVPTEEKLQKVKIKYLTPETAMTSQSASKRPSTWQALQGAHHYSEKSRLQVVDKFTYIESTLSRVVHIDDEVNARIAKASAAFGRLRSSVWDRSGISVCWPTGTESCAV